MKKHFLLTNLVAPLALGAAVLMLASLRLCDPWRSLFVNLAAGLIGSMITVFFIDRIIRRNEQYQWTKVLNHVGRQVNILANGTTSSLRLALGLRLPQSWMNLDVANDPRRMRKLMLAFIEEELLPKISELSAMNQEGWRTFANNILATLKDVDLGGRRSI